MKTGTERNQREDGLMGEKRVEMEVKSKDGGMKTRRPASRRAEYRQTELPVNLHTPSL